MINKKQKTNESNEVFEGILQGLKDAKAFLSGKSAKKSRVHLPVNVKAIREKQKFSQTKFANTFGFSINTLRNWEQGKRVPDKSAQILLAIIDKNPEVVMSVVK